MRKNGEAEIFREAAGLEEALLEACAALEDPLAGSLGMHGQHRQEPPQYVVLLDDVDAEMPLD
jgi:hypothetical protein